MEILNDNLETPTALQGVISAAEEEVNRAGSQ